MPHVIVKLYPGRSEAQKQQLTADIVRDVTANLNCQEAAVSVAFEDVEPGDWSDKVYKADILDNWEKLYKKPGYNPFE